MIFSIGKGDCDPTRSKSLASRPDNVGEFVSKCFFWVHMQFVLMVEKVMISWEMLAERKAEE